MEKKLVEKELTEKYPHHRPSYLVKVEGVETEVIEATYVSMEEWVQDKKGYFIIKVFYEKGFFGARFHTNEHVPKFDIVGTDAQEVVQTIVRKGLVGSMQHAAYLGLELQKAQIALEQKLNYVQCSDLDFSKKTEKTESDNLPE
jgi:hypothetical protein